MTDRTKHERKSSDPAANRDAAPAETGDPAAPAHSGTPPSSRSVMDLLQVMAALRDPETGCPWDIEQTFATIAPYTIEEAYEVADAIARNDMADLKDELGDLLLQVVYHARIAQERGAFGFDDVVDAISEKMIRRHPHVFGTPEQRAAGAAPGFWERIKTEENRRKAAERGRLGIATPSDRSLLDGVPANLPPLAQAVKLQKKAATVGFDWPSLKPVLDKMREELDELDDALTRGDMAETRGEFGDLLFVMANVARHLDIDPAAALSETNQKFRRRFRRIEELLAQEARDLDEATLSEMDALWNIAKREQQRERD